MRLSRLAPLFTLTALLGCFAACSSSDDAAPDGGADAGGGADTGAADGSAPPDGGVPGDGGAPSDGGGGTDAGSDGGAVDGGAVDGGPDAQAKLTLTSSAFANGGVIPTKYVCTGQAGMNLSPPLAWSGAPAGTMTYAIVMRDPTLGGNDNFHWTIFDIPSGTTSLAEGVQAVASPAVPAGAKQIADSFGVGIGYFGPCPPATHQYVWTLYALSVAQLPTPIVATPSAYESTIQGVSLASATLQGSFP